MGRYEITGFSVPWFGLSWRRIARRDKETAQGVLLYLEDRRLLYWHRINDIDDRAHCVASALQIRTFLTQKITSGDIGDSVRDLLRAMRATCRDFLVDVGPSPLRVQPDDFGVAVGLLRARMGVYIAALSDQFDLPVSGQLGTILPPTSEDEPDLSWIPGFDRPWPESPGA